VKEPSVLGLVGNAPTALSTESELRSGAAAEPGRTAGGEPIRVLVVDDHVLFRRGLDMVLGQEPDIALVGV
jgi:hypothetical protein